MTLRDIFISRLRATRFSQDIYIDKIKLCFCSCDLFIGFRFRLDVNVFKSFTPLNYFGMRHHLDAE